MTKTGKIRRREILSVPRGLREEEAQLYASFVENLIVDYPEYQGTDEQKIRARIFGTGRGIPSQVLTNNELEKVVDTSAAWIMEQAGARGRRILEEGRTTSDLGAEAARNACEMAGWNPKTLDCIILGTIALDGPTPATAMYVQQELGCSGAAAFDLSAACAGFIYGLAIGDTFVRTGQFHRVCVIGVEVLSRALDRTDRTTCVPFSDGVGAVLLGPDAEAGGILSTHLYADGAGTELLHVPAGGSRSPTTAKTVKNKQHYIGVNGLQVFTQAVHRLSEACEIALKTNHMAADDIDHIITNQANLRILQDVADRCQLPIEKFYVNIERYGNTLAASIPIALDELVRTGELKMNDRVLLCAFGAGFSWGSAILQW